MQKPIYKVVIILLIAINLYSCNETQKSPSIENGEFPFRFVCKINGETHVIEDTVICEFDGFDYSALALTKPRSWKEKLKSEDGRILITEEYNTNSVLEPKRINEKSEIVLCFGMGAYYMSDPNGTSLIHGKPHICYGETYSQGSKITHMDATPMSNARAKKLLGLEIIEWNFSEPIKNTFE